MGKTRKTRRDGSAVDLTAVYERHPTGAWLARLKRSGVEVAVIGPTTDLHDTFHGVLTEISDRCRRLDMRHATLHGTKDGGLQEFALIAAHSGWLECRDAVCMSDPVTDDTVDLAGDPTEQGIGPMFTLSTAGSECPPEFRDEQDDIHRRALERYGSLILR